MNHHKKIAWAVLHSPATLELPHLIFVLGKMLPSSAIQRAPCWLMCSCCLDLCLLWIYGDPTSLIG